MPLPSKWLTLIFLWLYGQSAYAQFESIYAFESPLGEYPYGSLIYDGQFLYGTSFHGGQSTNCLNDNCGVVFRILPDGSGYTILHAFDEDDGAFPRAALVMVSDTLYGMTFKGGKYHVGTIFKIHKNGSGFSHMFSFSDSSGTYPKGSLIYADSLLYGMTLSGGASDDGVIFSIKPNGTQFKILHAFNTPVTGGGPYADLVSDGTWFYGTTYGGGLHDKGVVFKILHDGSGYTKLLDFDNDIGINSWGNLLIDSTYLYGMTYNGGEYGYGVVFRIRNDGTNFSKLHDFDGDHGSHPEGSLTLFRSKLYGVTHWGGTTNDCSFECGVLFSLNTDGSGYNALYHFNETTGSDPKAAVTIVPPYLYGITYQGGAHKMGTIYRFGLHNTVDNGMTNAITVYPNPVNAQLVISGTNALGEVLLYDMTARVVFRSGTAAETTSLDLSTLSDGPYLLNYFDGVSAYFRTVIMKL